MTTQLAFEVPVSDHDETIRLQQSIFNCARSQPDNHLCLLLCHENLTVRLVARQTILEKINVPPY
jgi:hypothetical protein